MTNEIFWDGDIPALSVYLRALQLGQRPILKVIEGDGMSRIRMGLAMKLVKDCVTDWSGNHLSDFRQFVDENGENVYETTWLITSCPGTSAPSGSKNWQAYYDLVADILCTDNVAEDVSDVWNCLCPCTKDSEREWLNARHRTEPPLDGVCGDCEPCNRLIRAWAETHYCDEWMNHGL